MLTPWTIHTVESWYMKELNYRFPFKKVILRSQNACNSHAAVRWFTMACVKLIGWKKSKNAIVYQPVALYICTRSWLNDQIQKSKPKTRIQNPEKPKKPNPVKTKKPKLRIQTSERKPKPTIQEKPKRKSSSPKKNQIVQYPDPKTKIHPVSEKTNRPKTKFRKSRS